MQRWVSLVLLAATLAITGCAANGGYGYRRNYRYDRDYRNRYDSRHDRDYDRDRYDSRWR